MKYKYKKITDISWGCWAGAMAIMGELQHHLAAPPYHRHWGHDTLILHPTPLSQQQ